MTENVVEPNHYLEFINREDTKHLTLYGHTEDDKIDVIFDLVETCILTNIAVVVNITTSDHRDQFIGRLTSKNTTNQVKLIVAETENKWKSKLADCIKKRILFVLVFLNDESAISQVDKELFDISYSNLAMLIHDGRKLSIDYPLRSGITAKKYVMKVQKEKNKNKNIESLKRNCKKIKRAFVSFFKAVMSLCY